MGGGYVAYSELIKNYQRIRDYMRQFYVYGFKSREEYRDKSARSYDNERRRVESWLGEYMSFRQDARGKNVFLSVDSRAIPGNPLYKSFKARSFTAKDITLHFYILDLLPEGEELTAGEMMEKITTEYLSRFDGSFSVDESTLRKKLKEYEKLGLLEREKRGRETYYRRTESRVELSSWLEAGAFYSEEAPVGVIGSFLLDRFTETPRYFGFKHHYMLHALDSQILCRLLASIRERRTVQVTARRIRGGGSGVHTVCPLKIYDSVQSGRQYLLAYHYHSRQLSFYRLDAIQAVEPGEREPDYDAYIRCWEQFRPHLWGVSTGPGRRVDHIEMTVRAGRGEEHILRRLEREKRCGTVERLDEDTYRFQADVYDPGELLPWLRTFIGRITALTCSDQSVVETFYADLKKMREMYGGGEHAVQ